MQYDLSNTSLTDTQLEMLVSSLTDDELRAVVAGTSQLPWWLPHSLVVRLATELLALRQKLTQ